MAKKKKKRAKPKYVRCPKCKRVIPVSKLEKVTDTRAVTYR